MAKQPTDTPDTPRKREYDVVTTFWDGPQLREAGKGTVWKTDEEAKYLVPHTLKLKTAKAETTTAEDAGKADRKPPKPKR